MTPPLTSGVVLPELAISALQRGDALNAYFFADRWIRLGGANATNLLLRAEAAQRLSHSAAAMEDVRRGLARDPLHRLLNRRCAEWGEDAERLEAVRLLATRSRRDAEVGLAVLAEAGEVGAGAVRVEDGFAVGWLAWRREFTAQLDIGGRTRRRLAFEADPNHPYANVFGAACEIRIACPAEPSSLVSLLVDGRPLAKSRVPGRRSWSDEGPLCAPDTEVTVLIPVYDDYRATCECLISVAVEVESTPNALALVIDDGAPDPRIRGLLACFSEWSQCRVLRNPTNLGYVATVNRGLRRLPHGDVLLLNSDARLPWGALARFREAARAHPGVGVLNPLSNHGEFVSYPKPFHCNGFDEDRWRDVDRAAARCDAGGVIDIPSATGFCSYVTRACLDAVGGLSEAFVDGYLEDADFGLRAREAGFRNACAVSVYAPHIGSRSFKSAKRALVARNRGTLARRFPAYESECSAFLKADPLARARERLENALARESPMRRLVLGPARWRDAIAARAEDLASEGIGALLGLYEAGRLSLRGCDDAAPQNVEIELTTDGAGVAMALKRWPIDRVEYFWTQGAPAGLERALGRGLLPLDVVLAAPPRSSKECAWPRCEGVHAFDALVDHACASLGLQVSRLPRRRREFEAAPSRTQLAILYPFETPSSRRFLVTVAQELRKRGRTALLIGTVSREEEMLAQGLLATGAAGRADWPRLLDIHAPAHLALPYRDQGYWLIDEARNWVNAPAAYFDLAGSGFYPSPAGLALPLSEPDATAAAALLDWAFAARAATPVQPERVAA